MENINIEQLIAAASKKLGVSPERLRTALKAGNMSEITSLLSKSDRDKINAVMNDPTALEKLRRQYLDKK